MDYKKVCVAALEDDDVSLSVGRFIVVEVVFCPDLTLILIISGRKSSVPKQKL